MLSFSNIETNLIVGIQIAGKKNHSKINIC